VRRGGGQEWPVSISPSICSGITICADHPQGLTWRSFSQRRPCQRQNLSQARHTSWLIHASCGCRFSNRHHHFTEFCWPLSTNRSSTLPNLSITSSNLILFSSSSAEPNLVYHLQLASQLCMNGWLLISYQMLDYPWTDHCVVSAAHSPNWFPLSPYIFASIAFFPCFISFRQRLSVESQQICGDDHICRDRPWARFITHRVRPCVRTFVYKYITSGTHIT
jgi:hypothetical protein